jgi:hypothetical protein
VHLQVRYGLLHLESVLGQLLLDLLGFYAHLENFVNDFLEVFNQIVVFELHVFVGFVDDVNKHFAVVLQGTSQSLKVIIHLKSVR